MVRHGRKSYSPDYMSGYCDGLYHAKGIVRGLAVKHRILAPATVLNALDKVFEKAMAGKGYKVGEAKF